MSRLHRHTQGILAIETVALDFNLTDKEKLTKINQLINKVWATQ